MSTLPDSTLPAAPPALSLSALFLKFLRFGCLAFGGPVAQIAMLRQAAEAHEQLLIGYVGNDGTVAERMVTPERVEGGRLTAYDERSDSSRTFAVHRITMVSRPG